MAIWIISGAERVWVNKLSRQLCAMLSAYHSPEAGAKDATMI